MSAVELSSMLASLRAELGKAQAEGDGKGIKFEVKDVELELQVTVSEDTDVKGGVKFHIFNAGVEEKVSSQCIQKIKLTLTPKASSGADLDVSDTDDQPI